MLYTHIINKDKRESLWFKQLVSTQLWLTLKISLIICWEIPKQSHFPASDDLEAAGHLHKELFSSGLFTRTTLCWSTVLQIKRVNFFFFQGDLYWPIVKSTFFKAPGNTYSLYIPNVQKLPKKELEILKSSLLSPQKSSCTLDGHGFHFYFLFFVFSMKWQWVIKFKIHHRKMEDGKVVKEE